MANNIQIKRSLLSVAPGSLLEGEMAYVFGTDTLYIGAPSNTMVIIAGASTYAKLASPTFTGTPSGPTATAGTSTVQLATTAFVAAALASFGVNYQPKASGLTQIAAIVAANDDIVQMKAGAWINRTPAQVKADLLLTKTDVGLGNVDNTSDANKPVSTAQATAIGLKLSIANNLSDLPNVATAKTNLALNNVDNTSDANKPVSTAQAAANASALSTAKAYADGLVVGLWDDRGSYNAITNTYPTTGGSGTSGAVIKGDIWTVSVAGTLGGKSVTIGDTVRALSDSPAQITANWSILGNSIGYVAENITNKVTTISAASTDVQYASAKLLFDQLALKLSAANNLSDLINVATARTNLGLGTMATQAASAVAITGGTISGVTFDCGTF